MAVRAWFALGYIAFGLWIALFFATAIHECGHAGVDIILGAQIVDFQPFGRNAHTVAASLPASKSALVALGGVGANVLTVGMVLLLVPWRRFAGDYVLGISMFVPASLYQVIPFVICPWLGTGTDASKFVASSGASAPVIALLAGLCMVGLVLLWGWWVKTTERLRRAFACGDEPMP